jgi:hypothetical protein
MNAKVTTVVKTLKNGARIVCFKIPLPIDKQKRNRKYYYPVAPDLCCESIQRIMRDIHAKTGLAGTSALIYYHLRDAGWDDEQAQKIASAN